MAQFVHITSEKNLAAIRNRGIRTGPTLAGLPDSVYVVPVTPGFVTSHQWLRELRRGGARTLCGVYLRIPDDEQVFVGHYNGPHMAMTAAQAVAHFLHAPESAGHEVLIPRTVKRSEIRKIRHLPQIIGWRYSPTSHERPFCGCPYCVWPGTIRARRKSRAWEEGMGGEK
jgi:hypothetical protein